MKQGSNQKRHRGRSNGRRPQHGLSSNYESNGPDVRIKGSASQVQDRYQALARDAVSSGDRVAAENYYQHAEHYQRIINAHLAANPAPPAGSAAPAEGNGAPRTNGGREQPEGRQRNEGGRGRGRGRGQQSEAAAPNAPQPEIASPEAETAQPGPASEPAKDVDKKASAKAKDDSDTGENATA
jgi:hypothetical protein